jgi:hypothetical protein
VAARLWPIAFEKAHHGSITYQVPEPPSALFREEEFAKAIAARTVSSRLESPAGAVAGAGP